MKKITGCIMAVLVFCPSLSYAESYTEAVNKLCEAQAEFSGKRVTVIPFETDSDLPAGSGEEITDDFFAELNSRNCFNLVEKSELNSAMATVKAKSTKGKADAMALVKELNASGVIIGKVKAKSNLNIFVNITLISPQAKRIVKSAGAEIQNKWQTMDDKIDNINKDPEPTTYAAVNQEEPKPNTSDSAYGNNTYDNLKFSYSKGPYDYSSFDIFMGAYGSSTIDITFENTSSLINTSSNLGLPVSVNASEVELSSLETKTTGPIGLRFTHFSNIVGFDLGFRYDKYTTKSQKVTTLGQTFNLPDKFAEITSYSLEGNLLLRVPTPYFDPYIGFGVGLGILSVELPYTKGYTSGTWKAPVEETGVSCSFRIPLGVRWKVGENFHLITEGSVEAVTSISDFSRDIKDETDSYSVLSAKFIIGTGFVF